MFCLYTSYLYSNTMGYISLKLHLCASLIAINCWQVLSGQSNYFIPTAEQGTSLVSMKM